MLVSRHNSVKSLFTYVSYALLNLSLIYAIYISFNPPVAKAFLAVARWSTNGSEWLTVFVANQARGPFPPSAYGLVASAGFKWSNSQTGKNFNLTNWTNQTGPARVYVNETNFNNAGYGINSGATFRTIAANGQITAATVYLNNTWTWNTSCTFNASQKKADFLTVILHELGHTVVLEHDSTHQSSVMWPAQVCRQNLTQDDKDGIGSLYGP